MGRPVAGEWGTRISRRGFLFDGNRRRQAFDRIDVGFLHQFEELTRIGRQGFDVATLTFGIDRIEGERRLARAAEPGDHGQAVARDVDIDILEIVFAGAADVNGLHGSVVRGEKGSPIDQKYRLTGAA
jgi:hypothetical protein